MTSFYEIDYKTFGDSFCNEEFTVNENLALAAIICLGRKGNYQVYRDLAKILSNILLGDSVSIKFNSKSFSNILEKLKEKELIDTCQHGISILVKRKLIVAVQKKYGKILF